MSDIKISQYNKALEATEHYPTLFEEKKGDIGVQMCLTKLQNDIADKAVQTHKYNQKMRYLHTKNLCKSYNDQSTYHIESSFWSGLGRLGQIGFLGYSVSGNNSSKIFEKIINNFTVSNEMFKGGNDIYSSFHQRKDPAMKSVQLIEQKKVEYLTQCDNTETNIIDRIQQMFQSAKDLLSQLYKSFSS